MCVLCVHIVVYPYSDNLLLLATSAVVSSVQAIKISCSNDQISLLADSFWPSFSSLLRYWRQSNLFLKRESDHICLVALKDILRVRLHDLAPACLFSPSHVPYVPVTLPTYLSQNPFFFLSPPALCTCYSLYFGKLILTLEPLFACFISTSCLEPNLEIPSCWAPPLMSPGRRHVLFRYSCLLCPSWHHTLFTLFDGPIGAGPRLVR